MAAAGEAGAIDLGGFQDALDIIAGFGERDKLNPVHDLIKVHFARIAEAFDPGGDIADTAIIGGDGKDI